MNYIEFDFTPEDKLQQEQLIALLSEEGFEGFEETPGTLKAFIKEEDWQEPRFYDIMGLFPGLKYCQEIVENRNWNEQWESSFEPVLVNDFAAIRASFHEPITTVKHEIVITPKMSFGTGHHATTYLMMEQMAEIDFTGKTVIDFGTGTGVLAILAEKLGAEKIEALDNDEWSIDNSRENIDANACKRIHLYKAETIEPSVKADIILANINLNVITANLDAITAVCKPDTVVLFSGLLATDKDIIIPRLENNNLAIIGVFERNNWLAIKTKYTDC
ncbi:50S ribosomal protein L11 methyltransferase [Ferruginibacter sp. HRS2-29]|uniref:50S ribosomal protein L11 methyltransferase n=1 Tax=Ferruginibacter sp. HRS2-29 TaxID=2487334 RepID=UPI0020CE15AD|nr:50S ribosomal protein L11 methyltransferase [Ferruginibacter sp. HRS2-29]MCP9750314.1 50S ribosomal protein L11 methyltransferase [Ferruginibacter sp. HRS2-29]